MNPIRIPELSAEIVHSILLKVTYQKVRREQQIVASDTGKLLSLLNRDERRAVKRLFSIHPDRFGFRGKFLGIERVPRDLMRLRKRTYAKNGERRIVWPQFLRRRAYDAFRRMTAAMRRDVGRGLLIQSGYRSPAYQTVVFLQNLRANEYDFPRTARMVALPGYSEHGSARVPAIDVITEDGIDDEQSGDAFRRTKEYRWLAQNAEQFGFELSYPEGNKTGVIFEPWHWRYVGYLK